MISDDMYKVQRLTKSNTYVVNRAMQMTPMKVTSWKGELKREIGEGSVLYINTLRLSLWLPGIREIKLLAFSAAILRHLGGHINQTGHCLRAAGEILLENVHLYTVN